VAREGVTIDDTGLSYIVKASEGSMRDAQSLLDQIISFGGDGIAGDDVRDVLGFISSDILDRTIDAIAQGNSPELIETVAVVVDQGLNLPQYARELIGRMRDLLMMKLGLHDKVLGSTEDKSALAQRAEAFSEQDLIRYFDLLLRLESDLRFTAQPRFHLEVGLVKLAKAGHLRDIEDVIRELKQGVAPTTAAAAPPRSNAPAPKPATPTAIPPRQTAPPPPTPRPPAATTPRSDIIDTVKSDERRPAPPTRATDDKSLSSAKEEPLVKRFLEVFRGDIAQVKPPKGDT
jgi:DNA polymerase-3 subunit gamma/tau